MKKLCAPVLCLLLSGWPLAAYAEIIRLHAGDVIAAEGDSLTYGQDVTPGKTDLRPGINGAGQTRSPAPYPESLEAMLEARVSVENRGYPGDRSVDGLWRLADQPAGALTVLMYGTNDAWNFGGHRSGRVSLEDFKVTMRALVERRQKAGGQVILLSPPPIEDAGLEAGLGPYRDAVRFVAGQTGALWVDLTQRLKNVHPLWTDGVHLSERANQEIARAVAERIKID